MQQIKKRVQETIQGNKGRNAISRETERHAKRRVYRGGK